jgi:hypothetical protein
VGGKHGWCRGINRRRPSEWESIPASRYELSVSGGERAAPIDASLCGGRR